LWHANITRATCHTAGDPGGPHADRSSICGRKPKGYELHTSTGSGTGPATFLGGGHCKPGKVLIGGGVRPGTFLPAIGIGSSLADEDTQWLYELNVGATGPTSVTVSTICVP